MLLTCLRKRESSHRLPDCLGFDTTFNLEEKEIRFSIFFYSCLLLLQVLVCLVNFFLWYINKQNKNPFIILLFFLIKFPF